MSLAPGTRIGVYQVEAALGRGGMGEVYRARDVRLGRRVAIKVLPPELTQDRDRLARVEREARALAALNHPNIAVLYGVEETSGAWALVLELIEGETLGSRLLRGLSLSEALALARQIAAALDAAHEKGIVHRDLKLGNVMVTPAGTVKVLDFGLAKLVEAGSVDLTQATTETLATATGAVVGTPAYMSPEQARGQMVDKRTDIWAFGCVLFELLSGRRAFEGATVSDTLAAILFREPDWTALPEKTPAPIARLVRRCLRKAVHERLRDIGDASFALDEELTEVAPSPEARSGRSGAWWAAVGLASAAGALAGAALVAISLERAPNTATSHPREATRLTSDEGLTADPAISQDGTMVAYASEREGSLDIWLQQVAGGAALRLTRDAADESEPAFSPDRSSIAFRSERDGGGIYLASALGGGQPRLLAARGRRPRFSPDRQFIAYWTGSTVGFTPRAGEYRVFVAPVSGGAPREIAGFTGAPFPVWSPDGRSLLMLASIDPQPIASSFDWWLVPLDSRKPVRTSVASRMRAQGVHIAEDSLGPDAWSGDEVFFSDLRHVWAVPFDSATGEARTARQVTFGTSSDVQPAVAANGVMAFSTIATANNVWALPLDANAGTVVGTARRLTAGIGRNARAAMSVDGRRLAYVSGATTRSSLLIRDLEAGTVTDLGLAGSFGPALSPDGSMVAFESPETDPNNPQATVKVIPASGGPSRVLCGEGCQIGEWTSDSASMVVRVRRRFDLIHAQSGSRRPLIVGSLAIDRPELSPDNTTMAFRAVGQNGELSQVLLAPVHSDRPATEDEWVRMVPDEEDVRPCGWSPDGRLVYFLSARDGTRCLYAQRIDPRTRATVGAPIAVQHFHGIRNYRPGASGVISTGPTNAIRAGMFLFDYAEYTGNIWTIPSSKNEP